jgi:hypothetical protein
LRRASDLMGASSTMATAPGSDSSKLRLEGDLAQ